MQKRWGPEGFFEEETLQMHKREPTPENKDALVGQVETMVVQLPTKAKLDRAYMFGQDTRYQFSMLTV